MTKRTTRLLIVDDIHPVFAEKLTANHIAFDYLPTIGKEEALQVIHKYSALVIRSKFKVDAAFLDAAPGLTFIARGGPGMYTLVAANALEIGLTLINATDANQLLRPPAW